MSAIARRTLAGMPATLALAAAMFAAGMILTPLAGAASGTPVALPAGFLGLPSLHGIIEAVANGFFGALAKALVPSWLSHGTVATIQALVALPDPGEWTHVGRLQDEMTFLAAMLAPLTLTLATLRYWAAGLTGSAHPASALARVAGATGLLVAYRWIVEQLVAGTNTLTHGLLALPSVSGGLSRIIGVLFGGALLTGVGGVFGALLVIVGVVFAAALFATQVLLTLVLAVLIVAGPPLIALAAIPELAHLAQAWRDALITVALIPIGWSVLFATAGALCLDATSFTGGAGGLPGHVAAAFAGLITFALAVKLPLMALGHLTHVFTRSHAGGCATAPGSGPIGGSERVRRAHARIRAVGLEAAPVFGASLGRAAGALGTPVGGPLGAARRRVAHATRPSQSAVSSQPQGTRGASGEAGGIRARLDDARLTMLEGGREAAELLRKRGRNGAVASPVREGSRASSASAEPRGEGRREAPSGTRAGRSQTPPAATRPAPPTGASPPRPGAPRRSEPPRAMPPSPMRATRTGRPAVQPQRDTGAEQTSTSTHPGANPHVAKLEEHRGPPGAARKPETPRASALPARQTPPQAREHRTSTPKPAARPPQPRKRPRRRKP